MGLVQWVEEALEPLGPVSMRRMMGAATLYIDGAIFAIVSDDQLWFKADLVSDPIWDEAGCVRFTYQMSEGRSGSMNYRRAPDDVYDDADAMRQWATLALEASVRAPAKKPRKSPPKAAD